MRRLVVNALDPEALHTAVEYLQGERKRNEKHIARLMERIAYEACKAAMSTYGPSVEVTATRIDNGYSIEARGERVCFLEFGTGVYADTTENIFKASEGLPFEVTAGSWSMTEGVGTWQDVIDGKVSPEEWAYNRRARPGMYEAYKAIINHLSEWAREEFK